MKIFRQVPATSVVGRREEGGPQSPKTENRAELGLGIKWVALFTYPKQGGFLPPKTNARRLSSGTKNPPVSPGRERELDWTKLVEESSKFIKVLRSQP